MVDRGLNRATTSRGFYEEFDKTPEKKRKK
jgi:hypothetical protein